MGDGGGKDCYRSGTRVWEQGARRGVGGVGPIVRTSILKKQLFVEMNVY